MAATARSLRTLCVLVVATLVLGACGEADTTLAPATAAAPGPVPPVGALAILDRVADAGAGLVPSVVGRGTQEAGQALGAKGATAQFVRFTASDVVTAQYPEPGAEVPEDGVVLLWLGTPDAPAAPAASAEGTGAVPAPADPTVAPLPTFEPPPSTPPTPVVTAPYDPPAYTPPPVAPAPSDPAPVDRESIRTLPPAETGTVLAGRASWYGPGFEGRPTACGGTFDPTALTLASRELRCGTRVRITGPTGASVEAVVADWGPEEWTGRRFDLSQATFARIDKLGTGVIDVTVEVI